MKRSSKSNLIDKSTLKKSNPDSDNCIHTRDSSQSVLSLYQNSHQATIHFLTNNIKPNWSLSKSLSSLPSSTPLLSDILRKLFQRGSIRLTLEDKKKILSTAKTILGEIWCHRNLKETAHSYHPLELLNLIFELDDDELSNMAPRTFHENLKKIFLQASDLHTNYISLSTPFLIFVPLKIDEYWIDQFHQRFLITGTSDAYSQYLGKTVTHWNGIPVRTYLSILGEYSGGSNEESKISRALEMLTTRNLATNLIPVEDFVVLTVIKDESKNEREEIKIPWEVYDAKKRKVVSSQNDLTNNASYQQSITFDEYIGMNKSFDEEIIKRRITKASSATTSGPFIYEIKTINCVPWGYIKITTFAPDGMSDDYDMPGEFIKIAETLKNNVEGLIIDLRDNGGGNLVFAEDIVNYLRPEEEEKIQRNKASFRLTPFNKSLVKANPRIFDQWTNDIKGSWSYRHKSGDIYSKGYEFRSNRIDTGLYWGSDKPKILLINSRCYSATDSFVACFQDNQCGSIVGQNNSTGGGGANVFDYSLIRHILSSKKELYDLDGLVNFRVAIRRITRRKINSGLAIEDLGVTPDVVIRPSKRDYENGEEDFLKAVIVQAKPKANPFPSAFGKAIYFGDDTRVDWYSMDKEAKDNSLCVGAFVEAGSLEENGNVFTLAAGILGKSYRLQKGEKFWDQPSFDPITHYGAYGSAFLFEINGAEYLITAGHCVSNPVTHKRKSKEELDMQRIIFGFKQETENSNPLVNIDRDRVYTIKDVIACQYDLKTGDWAVCTLDRPVKREIGIKPCTNIALEEVKKTDRVYVLGHPSGLPMKKATGLVRDMSLPKRSPTYFRTDLTTFAGNSGSPVFSSKTHQLVGILVRGATDYEATPEGEYRASIINYWGNEVGEDVTRILSALKDAKLV